MKKIIFSIIIALLFIPTFTKAATLIDNLEVEASADTFTFNMSKNSWTYTLYTEKSTATIKVTPKAGVTIKGDGEVPIQEGNNRIEITATDGNNTENYVINLNVVKLVSEDGKIVNPPTGNQIPLITTGILLLMGSVLSMMTRKAKIYKI